MGYKDPRKVVVIPMMVISFHLISSFPQSRHQISIFAYLEINIAKYRSTSVSECNFDKPAFSWVHQILQKCVMFMVGGPYLLLRVGFVKIYFSAAHIFSRKGMKGMKPSSSSGSQSSFIRPLASSLVSFSPRLVRRRKSSFPIMVLSLFLS